MKKIEIELRYEVLEPKKLVPFTQELAKLKTRRIVDHYLDTSGFDLIKNGIFVRIRDNKKLDIKFNRECLQNPDLEGQPYCEEYSFTLPLEPKDLALLNETAKTIGIKTIDRADLRHFKTINNIGPALTIDKKRSSYTKDDYTIDVDTVAHLGTFLEIEMMADDTSSIDEVTRQMKKIIAPLSLKPLSAGYVSLMLRKNNFDIYLQSRYLLKEDIPLSKKFRRDHA